MSFFRTKFKVMELPEWKWYNERINLIDSEIRRHSRFDRILDILARVDLEYERLKKEKGQKMHLTREQYFANDRGIQRQREQLEYIRLNHLYGDSWQKVGWVEPNQKD